MNRIKWNFIDFFIKKTLFSLNFLNGYYPRPLKAYGFPFFRFCYFKKVIEVDQPNIDQYANESAKIKFRWFFQIIRVFYKDPFAEATPNRQFYALHKLFIIKTVTQPFQMNPKNHKIVITSYVFSILLFPNPLFYLPVTKYRSWLSYYILKFCNFYE